MSLDFTVLGKQVRQMSNTLAQDTDDYQKRIAEVLTMYQSQAGNEADITERANLSSKSAGLLASPYEPFLNVHDRPPVPPDYTLIATDGSQIERDRHGRADYYLINIGKVYLRYGSTPTARLTSEPTLYFEEDDLYIGSGPRRMPIEGKYIGFQRDRQELSTLAAMSSEIADTERPALGLLDGMLIHWKISGEEKTFQEKFLGAYLDCLDRLHEREFPIAGYTSRTRANEVVGAIRMMYCPHVEVGEQRAAQCNQCPDLRAGLERTCHPCHDLTDAQVFSAFLSEGQRSPLFISMSQINIDRYREHLIHFFYLRVMRDIARVEVPQWVARNEKQVDLVHTLVYDQCVRGQGYPVAIARAHEKAVVRGADRRAFLQMVESSLLRADLPATLSSKQESKEVIRT